MVGKKLPYDTLKQVRDRLVAVNPIFCKTDAVTPAPWGPFGKAGATEPTPFHSPIGNFYMTDPVSRASETMAKCTATYIAPREGKTGTHG
jgi:NADH-quinone oxidoreductase subunit G